MFIPILKRIFVILLMFVSALSVKAQQIHFVYLQTENGQPFYVRLNNKVLSSSPAGYIILPELKEGDYHLIVGFPKNEFPEEDFQIAIQKKNEGFLLKNFGEKGWGLFNMQSLALLPGTAANIATASVKIQDDPFSKMLANVVKDSSLLQNNEPVEAIIDTPLQKNEKVIVLKDTSLQNNEPVKSKIDKSLQKNETAIDIKDTSLQKNEMSISTPVIKNPEPVTVPVVASPITRLLSAIDKEGMQMVYLDRSDNKNDTIRVFIPREKIQNPKAENSNTVVENNKSKTTSVADTSQLTITPTIVKIESDTITLVNDTIRVYKERVQKKDTIVNKKVSELEPDKLKTQVTQGVAPTDAKSDEKQPALKNENNTEIIVLPKVVTSSKVNSDCKAFATDGDFLKLRKKMAAENNNDDMIRIAKKVFRTRCFSTEQIKNLSFLFLTDEGKYMFFDAAYPFTSDSDQYNSLKSQLSDEYYINRFEAMIHK
jgi:hypothetical protein